MKGICISFVEKTIALGGVAIGIINAQLAVKTIGNSIKIILKSFVIAKEAIIGRNNKVVAVLLVISVMNEINNASNNIKKKISNSPNISKEPLIHSAKPEEVIKLAKLKPPPKRIKIFQGMLLNHSLSNKNLFFS